MRARSGVFLVLSFLLILGCSTYRQHLNRGQSAYEQNQYERALAIWRDLERDMDSLTEQDRARYAYYRGMTDFRLGYRLDARHWLAISKAIDSEFPGGLGEEHRARVEETLDDLNLEVFQLAPTFDDTSSTVTETVRSVDALGLEDGKCRGNADCPTGNSCQVGECVPL